MIGKGVQISYRSLIELRQVVEIDKRHRVVNIEGAGCIAVILDVGQILSGICDALEVGIPGELNEFKVSLNTLFHVVIDAEVAVDRCKCAGAVLLFGREIDAFSGPESSAFEAKVIVILGRQGGLAPAALVDSLRDDRAVDFDAVFRRVLSHILGDIDDEVPLGLGKVIQFSDNLRDLGGRCFLCFGSLRRCSFCL